MACSKCSYETTVITIASIGELCGRCLSARITARFKKTIREIRPLKHSDNVAVIDGPNKDILLSLLEPLAQERGFHITPEAETHFDGKIAEDTIQEYFKFNNKEKPTQTINSPLSHIPVEELEVYCTIHSLPKPICKTSPELESLNKLETQYPGSKYGLLKSIKELEKLDKH